MKRRKWGWPDNAANIRRRVLFCDPQGAKNHGNAVYNPDNTDRTYTVHQRTGRKSPNLKGNHHVPVCLL